MDEERLRASAARAPKPALRFKPSQIKRQPTDSRASTFTVVRLLNPNRNFINTLKDLRVVIRNDLRTAYEHREGLKHTYDQAVAFLNNPALLAAPWQAQVYQQRGDIYLRRLREADIRIDILERELMEINQELALVGL
ncbi:hypothetical protein E8E13_007105 [Curvularia kusanoi]|uniref:Uncharacterized protein n=1 Tax=Curvularia kusanoi TaxID=90978 RepID=A0A9P4T9N3_CURKU|nr:hypothetical protein E8E13_007105 [Curvularia kusanoi]